MLIDKFSSAFEYYLNELVEREKCIKNIVNETIKENEYVKKEVIISKVISR